MLLPKTTQILRIETEVHHIYRLMCAKSLHLCLTLCDPMYRQSPLSMEFSRQEYWSGLPCPPPWYLPDPGIEPPSLMSPELASRFFTTGATWEAPYRLINIAYFSSLTHLPVLLHSHYNFSVLTRESRRNSRKTTWLPRHRKMKPFPATAPQVAKVLEFQLQHQSFQFRTDFL